jgi:hypothetical protein
MSQEQEGLKIREILQLQGVERLESLLDTDEPMKLVRTLPDRDLYLTVREVGPIDALPLIALASSSQIHHLVDLEAWRLDRFDALRAGAWVSVFLEAGEDALNRFITNADDELLSSLFLNWARATPVEYDDQVPIGGIGETEAGDERGFISPDGYYRFNPELREHAPAVRRMAELLMEHAPGRYQQLLWDSRWELPAELEERAMHWRQSRLEEHGYPTLEEAEQIYQPPRGLKTTVLQTIDSEGGILAVPSQAPALILADNPAWFLLEQDLEPGVRDRVFHELSALANRIMVADGMDTGLPKSHEDAIRKAGAFITIALTTRRASEGNRAVLALEEIPVVELFREGYALVEALRAQSSRLLTDGWPSSHERSLDLIDPPLRQHLAALRNRRPQYYQAATPGDPGTPEQYRDFLTLAEIHEAGNALDLIEKVGTVLVDHMGLDIARLLEENVEFPFGAPRFSTLLLTMMAWNSSREEIRLEPLPADVAADFIRNVASRRTAGEEAPGRALEKLVGRLATSAGLNAGQVTAVKGYGQAGLASLTAECAQLDPGAPLDQHSISCLLLEKGQNHE